MYTMHYKELKSSYWYKRFFTGHLAPVSPPYTHPLSLDMFLIDSCCVAQAGLELNHLASPCLEL